MGPTRPPRRWLARGLALLVVCSLLAPATAAALSGGSNEPGELRRGTVRSAAEGSTVVGVQGFHFKGRGSAKKPARLVSVGPQGATEWVLDGEAVGARWFYDVDPLSNGNLLVTSTNATHTIVFELDPDTRERVWIDTLPMADTHDVDALNETHLVVADKDGWNESAGTSDDRVFVYDRTSDTVTWEWRFREHLPTDLDGGVSKGWSHVNDVDPVGEHGLLVSPRNFDQVLLLNRSTDRIEWRLGADGEHATLYEPHNPDHLETDAGEPTVLVADSENDRVVEYTRVDGTWTRTWSVGSSRTLSWPRDADRLPNGNTLIVDSMNHRVIEVTPRGRIVWEYYATWGPYDAERVAHGDGSTGPTMRDLGVTGHHGVRGSAGDVDAPRERSFAAWFAVAVTGTPVEGPGTAVARTWSHVGPWLQPAWLDSWDFAALVGALVVAAGWGAVESLVYLRRALRRALPGRERLRRVE
jgi:hypothetical protein